MARLVFPDEGDRLAYSQLSGSLQGAAGVVVTVWSDSAATVLADIQTLAGAPITGSQLTIDDDSLIPQFLGPDGDVRELWVTSPSNATPVAIFAEPVSPGPFAVVVPGAAAYVARKCSDDSVISSSTDAITVINAALVAANAEPFGGRVVLAHGLFELNGASIVMLNRTQLVGFGGHQDMGGGSESTDVPVGTVVRAIGTWVSGDDMVAVGALGAGNFAAGCLIADISFDANNLDINVIHGRNAKDLKIERCAIRHTLVSGQRAGIEIEGDQATNAGSGADAEIRACWIRGHYRGVYAHGTSGGATDGKVIDSKIWTCTRAIDIQTGGWIIQNNHLVGNSSVDVLLYTKGAPTIVTGNYFDSVKNGGWCLELDTGANDSVVTGNYFNTAGDATTIAVKFTAQGNAVQGNTYKTQGGAFLKYTNAISGTTGGLVVNNMGEGPLTGVIWDNTGTAVTQPNDNTNRAIHDNFNRS